MKKNLLRLALMLFALNSPLTGKQVVAAEEDIDALYQRLEKKGCITRSVNPDDYTQKLLKELSLERDNVPFSYQHATELYSDVIGQPIPLTPALERLALDEHAHLNQATFFDLSLLSDPHRVRKQQLKKKKGAKGESFLFEVKTEDNNVVRGTYLDRGKKDVIIVGGGFTNCREQMAPFGDMFGNYDVVFFDYRGHGEEKAVLTKPNTWKSTLKQLFGVDPKEVTLGLTEEKDVKAVVDFARKRKDYKQVIGLGICYSAMIFLKTEAVYPCTFDKMILDGTWESLGHATRALSKDLKMVVSPQRGGWRNNWLMKQQWFQQAMLKFAQGVFGFDFNTLSVLDYGPKLREDLSILFVHGKDDIFIGRDQFEAVWLATSQVKNRTALITSNEHVWNHLKQKEVYKEISDLFITKPYNEFTQLLVDPTALVDHKTDRINRLATPSV